jgi:hypothetical protein
LTRPFRYYLLRSDGRSLQIINDVVTSLSNKAALPQTPDGWQEIVISWERDAAKYGIQRNFTLPIQFVRDGAKICKHIVYNENFDSQIFLLIQKLNLTLTNTTFQWIYDYFYRGEIDWTTFTDDDPKVSVSIMEGGLSKLLKANESTQYSIPLDEDAKNIRMDGINIQAKYSWIVTERNIDGGLNDDGQVFPFISLLPSDSNAPGIAVFSVETNNPVPLSFDYDENTLDYFMTAQNFQSGVITFSGTVVITGSSGAAPQRTHIDVWNVRTGLLSQYDITDPLSHGTPGTYPFSQTITLQDGDRIFFVSNQNYQEWTLEALATSKYPQTIIKAFDPLTLYRKLVEKITGFADDASSSLLANCPYFITSGDAVRGIDGASIKTSLADFFKAYNVYLMAGMAIESNKIALEARSHFYDSSVPIALGNAKGCKITAAADMLGSSIKIGHAEQNIDDVNGKFDFNGFHIYTTPQTRVSRQIDLQSPYKAGPYEIEITRINLDGKTTTDNDNDNDIYVIDVDLNSITPSVVSTVSFNSAGFFIAPFGIDFIKGQKIRITGSTSNDNDYVITDVADLFGFAQVVAVDKPLTNESDVSVLIEWLSGLVYDLDRSIVPNDSTFDANGNILTGFPDKDTIFNIRLSPKRLLHVHQQWLRSILYNYEPGLIKFQSANRYASFTAGGIKENDDLQIADMGDKMFLPFKFEFEDQVPVQLINLMEANPNRCFSFVLNGITYKGFNLKVNQAANTEASQSFLLLSTADNDPSTLVTI